MQIEHRITVATPAQRIFDIYQDVTNWPTWDPDTRSANLDGPFQVGSRGRLTPAKGNAVPMVLTEVEPGRCFTVVSRIPFLRMVFEHVLTPAGEGTEMVHRVTFSGPLSFVLGPILARRLNAGLPVTLRSLKTLAETGRVA